MSSSSGAPAPIFSYAQAAKGLASAAPTQSHSRNESPAASDKSVKDRSVGDSIHTSSALKSPRLRSQTGDRVSGESTATNTSTPVEGLASASALEAANKEGATHSQQVPLSDSASSPASHVDAHSPQDTQQGEIAQQLPNGRKASSDDSTVPATQDQETPNVSEKKSRDGEDDWEKVSVPSLPAAETQYKAAPIPSVNVWQVRREAQAAKKKDFQKPIVPAAPNGTRKSRSASEDLRRRSSSKELTSIERESKNTETTAASHRKDVPPARSHRPDSQHGERADADAPPPVIDTSSWPTPENSNLDDRRKSASYERPEKLEAKPGPQKSHGNKWVAVPFVPTAKFETQLPPAAARRGGRGGIRGGRDNGGRGGGYASASAEKQDATTSMGPPPLPRQSGEQDRGRRSDGQQGVRGASVPTTNTRPASGEDPVRTFRKSSAVEHKDQSASENVGSVPPTVQQSVEDQAIRTEHSSRSSSRHTGNTGNRRVNGERNTPVDQPAGGIPQSKEPNPKYPFNTDRNNKTSATGNSRGNGEFGRDRGSGKVRDWSRDKPESAREKVESWRDRESSGDQGSRRGGRSDRGRGTYRSRGEHSYNQPFTSSHAYTSPLPQNGFEPPSRSTSHNEARSRQASQPFVPSQATNTPRANPRSQSIPVGMMFPGYYNGMPAMPQQGLASIQTDMSMYGYPSQMQMQPSIMSAMPYNDPLNSYALLSMVMTQIEYYFSIDNLCKDLFLRKHMDGQGYVPLSVIANFKRIKTLTEDNLTIDNLRYVCQQVKSVEFLPGTDGDDRLRRREGWRDFVLPMEERFETARNDGPLHNPESYSRQAQQDQAGVFDPSFGYGQLRSPSLPMPTSNGAFQANSPMSFLPAGLEENQMAVGQPVSPFDEGVNGAAGRPPLAAYSRTPANAARSPPTNATAPLNNIVNGHHRQGSRADIEENVFPDDQIPNVNIRMQPHILSGAAPSFPGIARVASGGSSSGHNETSNMPAEISQSRLPGLRGGAASPQQLEQFRGMSFDGSNTTPLTEGSVIYFTKDGHETQLPPPQPGQYDQTYLSLHDVAFQQRQMGIKDALEPLYNFWTDFLVDKFNLGMYQEFKNTAVNDLQEGNDSGMSHLVRYFGKVLSGPVPISERLAVDMVHLSRDEQSEKRPVFQTMRAAWRNGATNMKTIKRLGDALSAEEKAELDKSG
ncbi:hypothetical protein G647_06156 [Cladophialophora carrionii CBS 160.54]|uniref:HTH La-type RNA-binding domain-containing protein n=1 Tax=Cladophialophora carrionii CBS 160.54 TaxID=1279043 RepID=V9D5D2_9EURO|nr:uncharacterized protein G647_06156 [Cladophialophora carrionii CBS 160.54]ETI22085.1 hypothetical protein G647_06156 [Cladophialophora carrionii CBS 160.54]